METTFELEDDRTRIEKSPMGKVIVEIELSNSRDEEDCESGLLSKNKVRRTKVEALVDTGATLLSIPEEEIQKLGLRLFKEVKTRFANGQSSIRKIYGPVVINLMGRSDIVLAMAGHPGMPALLGQIPLEGLDLMVDSKRRKLVPGHPESPDMQMVDVY